jgi:hypothetical protein
MDDLTKRVYRQIPNPVPDGMDTPIRLNRFGEIVTTGLPGTKHFLSDEGSYFIATNPTPGTAIAHVVLAAFDDTKPYVLLRNQDSPTDPLAKRMYLDYIKLLTSVVPASAAEWGYVCTVDSSAWAARYTSGGTTIVPVNANGDISRSPVGYLQIGAITAVAGVGRRIVSRGRFRGVVPTIYDEYILVFGTCEGGSGQIGGAGSSRIVCQAPPVVVGPGQNFALNLFGISNAVTAATYEFEIGWWER